MNRSELIARLQVFIRENLKGGCKVFSLGDKCQCPLCDLEHLSDALQEMERVPMTDRQIESMIHEKHFHKNYVRKLSDQMILDWYKLGVKDGESHHDITPPENKE